MFSLLFIDVFKVVCYRVVVYGKVLKETIADTIVDVTNVKLQLSPCMVKYSSSLFRTI